MKKTNKHKESKKKQPRKSNKMPLLFILVPTVLFLVGLVGGLLVFRNQKQLNPDAAISPAVNGMAVTPEKTNSVTPSLTATTSPGRAQQRVPVSPTKPIAVSTGTPAATPTATLSPTSNPAALARDDQRTKDITALVTAVWQYAAENGALPPGIPVCPTKKDVGTGAEMYNLQPLLAPAYIARIPKDPLALADSDSRYRICYTAGSGRNATITSSAPLAETGVITFSKTSSY